MEDAPQLLELISNVVVVERFGSEAFVVLTDRSKMLSMAARVMVLLMEHPEDAVPTTELKRKYEHTFGSKVAYRLGLPSVTSLPRLGILKLALEVVFRSDQRDSSPSRDVELRLRRSARRGFKRFGRQHRTSSQHHAQVRRRRRRRLGVCTDS